MEQHIALTESYLKSASDKPRAEMGLLYLQFSAKDVIEECADLSRRLSSSLHPQFPVPTVVIEGHVSTNVAYIQSHLRYMVGEILRNSFEAAMERYEEVKSSSDSKPVMHPIIVTICDAPEHVIFRFSDRSCGIPPEIIPYLWSFVKGPRSHTRFKNLMQVPALAASFEELQMENYGYLQNKVATDTKYISSLSSLTTRSPSLRLGIGLPMSRIYAEYWGGKLEVQSLEGYGCDVFLHISKFGTESSLNHLNKI